MCSYDECEAGGLVSGGSDSTLDQTRDLLSAFVNSCALDSCGGDGARRGGGRQARATAASRSRASRSPPDEASPAASWARPIPGPPPSPLRPPPRLGRRRSSDKAARERSSGLPREVGQRVSRQRAGGGASASLRRDPVAGRARVAAACGSELRAEAELLPPEARCLEPGVSCAVLSFRRFPSLLLQDPRAGRRNTRQSPAAERRFFEETVLAPPPFLGLGLGRSAGLGGPSWTLRP